MSIGFRFASIGEIGNIINVKGAVERGQMGVGMVHPIPFRVKDATDHIACQNSVHENSYAGTDVVIVIILIPSISNGLGIFYLKLPQIH